MTGTPTNGPSTREFQDLKDRVHDAEKEIQAFKEWRARAHGIASILGFIAGLFSAAVVTAVIRAIGLD